jgi:hypothetical protein
MGQVEAISPQEALQRGLRDFSAGLQPAAWWVAPAGEVLQNDPEEAPSLFGPARDKTFRLSTDFRTITAMRRLKTVPRPLSPPGVDDSPAGLQAGDPGLPVGRETDGSST